MKGNLRRLALVLELAALASAVGFAIATLAGGADTANWAVLTGALAALLAVLRRQAEPDDKSDDPKYVRRLVDEAAFAANYGEVAAHEAPEWLMEELRARLQDPVLIPRRGARKALAHAESVYQDYSARLRRATDAGETMPYSPLGGPEIVDPLNLPRKLLEPLFELVPPATRYLQALRDVPLERRVPVLAAGYQIAYQEGHDRKAWPHLQYLKELGDVEKLKEILAERLISMENEGFGGPAYQATRDLAKEVNGVQFKSWYDKSVRPFLEPET